MLWNVAAGLVWVVMILIPSSFERMSLTLLLSLMSSGRILSGMMKQLSSLKRTAVQQHKSSESPRNASQNMNVFSAGSNKNITVNNALPNDLDLSGLDIGTRGVKCDSPSKSHRRRIVACSPPVFTKPRPVISPSRFSPSIISYVTFNIKTRVQWPNGLFVINLNYYINYLLSRSSSPSNLTKASWVAGGYWQHNNSHSGWESPSPSVFSSPPSPSGTHTTLTRSSSQSSGFGSSFHLNGGYNRSPPDSRPESTLEEIDQLSLYSENVMEPSSASIRYAPESNSMVPYTFARNDLSRTSMMSSLSSVSDATLQTSSRLVSAPMMSQSSWLLPFLFGFSLALNLCVLTYCVFLHSSKS